MKAFAELCHRIDESRSAGEKVEALTAYLGRVPAADAIRAVSFLSGRKLPRAVSAKELKPWAAEVCGLPLWLLEACHKVSGDLAETIALLLPPARIPDDRPLHQWVEQCLLPLPKMTAEDRRREILRAWERMDSTSRRVWNKMITGAFRIEIARDVMARALARHGGLPVEVVLHRLVGRWPLTAETFERIMASAPQDADPTAPGPVSLYQRSL